MNNMQVARVAIFNADPRKFTMVGRVKVLDSFQNNSREFHEEGLFSTTIFGPMGSDKRIKTFGYIDANVTLLHPRIFNRLCSLKALYKDIMAGRAYAIFDEEDKDFVLSDQLNGQTGFQFFVSRLKDVRFKTTESKLRDGKIRLVEDNLDKALTRLILVTPAGLREMNVSENGDTDQHEVNELYRNILRIAGTLNNVTDLDSPVVDQARFYLQLAFNAVHDYWLEVLIKGKSSMINSKFGRRKQRYGTANVISVASSVVTHLDDPANFRSDQLQAGTFQLVKATEPLFIHHLRKRILNRVFTGESQAWLVNPKTMQREEVRLPAKVIDRWTTIDGLSKLINSFKNPDMRSEYVMVGGYYLTSIYRKDDNFAIVHDYDSLPDSALDDASSYITPITYGELFFTILLQYILKLPCDATRHPTTGEESVVPSHIYPMSTVNPHYVYELDDNWNRTGVVTKNFPNMDGSDWYDTLCPHALTLAGYGADFDGDAMMLTVNMSKEAISSVSKYLNELKYHISADGKLMADPLLDNVCRVSYNITGDYENAIDY